MLQSKIAQHCWQLCQPLLHCYCCFNQPCCLAKSNMSVIAPTSSSTKSGCQTSNNNTTRSSEVSFHTTGQCTPHHTITSDGDTRKNNASQEHRTEQNKASNWRGAHIVSYLDVRSCRQKIVVPQAPIGHSGLQLPCRMKVPRHLPNLHHQRWLNVSATLMGNDSGFSNCMGHNAPQLMT